MSEEDDWKKEYENSLNLSKDILSYFTVWDEEKGQAEVSEEPPQVDLVAELPSEVLNVNEMAREPKQETCVKMESPILCEIVPQEKTAAASTKSENGHEAEKSNPRKLIREERAVLKSLRNDIGLLIDIEPGDEEVWDATNEYMDMVLERRLDNTPIEEINFRKKGIRVSALRNAGYYCISDIMGISYRQLLSIDGIGEKSATLIIAERDALRSSLRSTIVYYPDPSDYTSVKPVLEFCKFAKSQELYFDALQKYNEIYCRIHSYLAISKRVDVLGWGLLNKKTKQDIIEKTETIEKKRHSINEEQLRQMANRMRCIASESQSEINVNFNKWSACYINYTKSNQKNRTINHKRLIRSDGKVIKQRHTESQKEKTFMIIMIVLIIILFLVGLK